MTATISLSALLDLASGAGFHLRPAETGHHAPLYTWCTVHPDGSPADVVYIGKAKEGRRVREEGGWAALDPHGDVALSGFVNVMRRNRAVVFPLAIEPFDGREDGFDPAPATSAMSEWSGPYPQRLRERIASGNPWTSAEIETFLIRLTVRCGAPIANSAGTGLWESWVGDPRDTLAVIATDSVKATELPVRRPESS